MCTCWSCSVNDLLSTILWNLALEIWQWILLGPVCSAEYGLRGSDQFRHVPQRLYRIGILGNLEAMWTRQAVCRVPRVSSEQCRSRTLCPTRASAVAARSYTYSTVVLGWVVCARWRPHGCQDPRVLSRTLHCNEIIKAINLVGGFLIVAYRCIHIPEQT